MGYFCLNKNNWRFFIRMKKINWIFFLAIFRVSLQPAHLVTLMGL